MVACRSFSLGGCTLTWGGTVLGESRFSSAVVGVPLVAAVTAGVVILIAVWAFREGVPGRFCIAAASGSAKDDVGSIVANLRFRRPGGDQGSESFTESTFAFGFCHDVHPYRCVVFVLSADEAYSNRSAGRSSMRTGGLDALSITACAEHLVISSLVSFFLVVGFVGFFCPRKVWGSGPRRKQWHTSRGLPRW